MTRREAAVVAAYTGVLLGNFADMHEYIETVMQRPVWTHEMGDPEVAAQIRAAAKADFLTLEVAA